MATQKIRPGEEHRLTMTSAGVSDWIKLKRDVNPFEASLFIYVSDGATGVSATVEYTPVEDPESAPLSAVNNHPSVRLQSVSEYGDSNLEFPATAVRMRLDSITTGEVYFSVVQPGTR